VFDRHAIVWRIPGSRHLFKDLQGLNVPRSIGIKELGFF
jgi:hypothetical protein